MIFAHILMKFYQNFSDMAANGLHPSFQNDIFDAEIYVDTDEIKPSQVSVSCD